MSAVETFIVENMKTQDYASAPCFIFDRGASLGIRSCRPTGERGPQQFDAGGTARRELFVMARPATIFPRDLRIVTKRLAARRVLRLLQFGYSTGIRSSRNLVSICVVKVSSRR